MCAVKLLYRALQHLRCDQGREPAFDLQLRYGLVVRKIGVWVPAVGWRRGRLHPLFERYLVKVSEISGAMRFEWDRGSESDTAADEYDASKSRAFQVRWSVLSQP